PAPDGRGRRILVVDDNADAASSLETLLRLCGHDARSARDGVEAIALAAEFRPHVMLLDLGMPRLNGYDVARRIRASEGGRAITLIATTGWGQEDDRRRTKEAG